MKNLTTVHGSGIHADRYSLYTDGDEESCNGPVPVDDDEDVGDPDENLERDGCLMSAAAGLLIWILLSALAIMVTFTGCASKEYVTVPEVHEVHHYIRDTVSRTDSITLEHTTVVREADSATLAAYGIQLEAMQHAWLIESTRMEREINRLTNTKTEGVTIRDSLAVPVPVPVVREVPAALTWWQRVRLQLANIVLIALGVVAVFHFLRYGLRR